MTRTPFDRVRRYVAVLAIICWTMSGAASAVGAAPKTNPKAPRKAQIPAPTLPQPFAFREDEERGFLVDVWLDGTGPYSFAIDTGAGSTIIAKRVIENAAIPTRPSRIEIFGLTDTPTVETRSVAECRIDLGDPGNRVPARRPAVVLDTLPEGLDGIIDPTEALAPFGFVLDIPAGQLRPFDPTTTPVRKTDAPGAGAVVAWLASREESRPFVYLADGRRALIDTGSGLGFAVTETVAREIGLRYDRPERQTTVFDLAGGHVDAHRVAAATIQVGSMELARIPTDVLFGASPKTPILLGRDALRPFILTFDPKNRLIRLAAS